MHPFVIPSHPAASLHIRCNATQRNSTHPTPTHSNPLHPTPTQPNPSQPNPTLNATQVLKENDYAKARAAHFKYLPVIKSLFAVGSNPEPVKEAMGFMGLLKDVSVRQPLTNLGAEAKEKLRTILKENGVIA